MEDIDKYREIFDKKISIIRQYITSNNMLMEDNYRERESMVKHVKMRNNYGYNPPFIIEAHSSGEESDIDDEKLNEPTIRDVCSAMIDHNTIMTVKSIAEYPSEARPGILIQNLDDWVLPVHVKAFLEDTPSFSSIPGPETEEIKIFKFKNVTHALCTLKSMNDCEKIVNFFNHPYKRKYSPSQNNKGATINVFLAYSLLDLTMSNYFAVIIRNLPPNCNHGNVKSFCENHVNGVLYALYPIKIKSSFCSIVVMRDLDDAEKLCVALNRKEIVKNKKIKCHLHPQACKIRKNTEKSHFAKYFNKKKIVFPHGIAESGRLISLHTAMTKLALFTSSENTNDNKSETRLKEAKVPNPVYNNVKSPPSQEVKSEEKWINKKQDIHSSLLSSLVPAKEETMNPILISQADNPIHNKVFHMNSNLKPNKNLETMNNLLKVFDLLNNKDSSNSNLLNTYLKPVQTSSSIGTKASETFDLNFTAPSESKIIEIERSPSEDIVCNQADSEFYSHNFKPVDYYDRYRPKKIIKEETNRQTTIKPMIKEDQVKAFKSDSQHKSKHSQQDSHKSSKNYSYSSSYNSATIINNYNINIKHSNSHKSDIKLDLNHSVINISNEPGQISPVYKDRNYKGHKSHNRRNRSSSYDSDYKRKQYNRRSRDSEERYYRDARDKYKHKKSYQSKTKRRKSSKSSSSSDYSDEAKKGNYARYKEKQKYKHSDD